MTSQEPSDAQQNFPGAVASSPCPEPPSSEAYALWKAASVKAARSFAQAYADRWPYPQGVTPMSDLDLYDPAASDPQDLHPSHMPPVSLDSEEDRRLSTAIRACLAAGEVILQNFGSAHEKSDKGGDQDFATETDVQADAVIRDILRQGDPQGKQVTEETFEQGDPVTLENTWIVDPLDGTRNFARHYPRFGVSIAYLQGGKTTLAAMLELPSGTLYTAIRGKGAWCQGQPLQVSSVSNLKEALLSTGFATSRDRARDIEAFATFKPLYQQSHGVFRDDAGAFHGVHAAKGIIDGFWQITGLHPWDCAAYVLILEEAGGVVTDLDGNPLDLTQYQLSVVAGNPAIHSQLLAALHACRTARTASNV